MEFKEEFYLNLPYEEAWQFFSDFPSPITVLPGIVEVREKAPLKYTGAVNVHIGFMVFKFAGNINIARIDHASGEVVIDGGAADPVLGGAFKAIAHTKTEAAGTNRTRITLQVKVGLEGLLGKLGVFVLRPKARNIVKHYAELVAVEIVRRRSTQPVNPLEAQESTAG